MRYVRTIVISELEVILAEVEKARESGGGTHLEGAHQLLRRLHSRVQAEAEDPLRRLVEDFRACTQDVDRGDLLYCSGFEPGVLSEALGVSMRRIYQLLRLARLPAGVKAEARLNGLSERRLRPLLKELQARTDDTTGPPSLPPRPTRTRG